MAPPPSPKHERVTVMLPRRRRLNGRAVVIMIVAAACLGLLSFTDIYAPSDPLRPLSHVKLPGPGDSSWHKYVRAPRSRLIAPHAVLAAHTKGNVTNARGLINGDGPAILSRLTAQDAVPEIVVDFGQNTVGILSITFAGAANLSDGLPGLRLAFSETLQYLSDVSDFSRSYNASCHSCNSGACC